MNYLDSIEPLAREGWEKYGINPVLTMSQAILESGNGASGLASKYNNQFGIKATKNWGGAVTSLSTKEEVGGKKVTVQAGFRAYSSKTDSFEDYFKLFGSSRYNKIVGVKDATQAMNLMGSSGYATDSQYANKLKSVASQYGLYAKGGQIMSGTSSMYASASNLKSSQGTNTSQGNQKLILGAIAIGVFVLFS